ncbi:MAG: WYL domain-containing protein [Desulfosarcina sp.]|nr:WYL domain-containing protein [Desulfobacterales bacterium]
MEPEFDPLLAIHRIRKIEVMDRVFEFPEDYDFEKVFNRNFGIIKEETFRVTVEFSGSSGAYVSERIWSPDQKIVRKRNGNLQLTFSASSEPETIAWILSFGKSAELIKPRKLVEKIKIELNRMVDLYFKNK